MLLVDKILEVLVQADGFVSYSDFPDISDADNRALFTGIAQLRERGFLIDDNGCGFRLSEHNTKLCASQLRSVCGKSAVFFESTDSTNTQAKLLAEQGAPEGTVVVAESQSAGRGRLGRSFFSPEGGLYFSLILRPEFDADMVLFITVAAAVSASRAIESVFGRECKIKWVNDIYSDDRKICGILTEGSLNAATRKFDYAVLGIGINLSPPQHGFPDELKDIAGSVLLKGAASSRMKAELIRVFTDSFFSFYKHLEMKAFLPEYRARSFLNGRTVEYSLFGVEHHAFVVGIDDDARLILSENGKEFFLNAGEVRLIF